MATTEGKLSATRQAISHKPPYCTGSCPLTAADGLLLYICGEETRRLDLPTASDEKLKLLADACEPATFGLNQTDVLDESYRKAGKMDNDKFFTKFTPETYQLMERISAQLLEGEDQERSIRAEPYKLNVYGKDSFFKSHKDTPRGSDMFGSLVVIFPTQHEGGALLLRHRGEEWTFDSAAAVTQSSEPHFGYIAFYSDVEHEVSIVRSGYRVTLTYNLYFKSDTSLTDSITAVAPDDVVFKGALSTLLDDPGFLPNGGVLGFGLRFMYPIHVAQRSLQHLGTRLKGCDAMIKRVCEQLSLETSLNAIYEVEDYDYEKVQVMVKEVFDLSNWGQIDEMLLSVLTESNPGGVAIYPYGTAAPTTHDREALEVAWISDLTALTRCEMDYIAYGNEASAAHTYCDISLMVRVGEPGNRAVA